MQGPFLAAFAIHVSCNQCCQQLAVNYRIAKLEPSIYCKGGTFRILQGWNLPYCKGNACQVHKRATRPQITGMQATRKPIHRLMALPERGTGKTEHWTAQHARQFPPYSELKVAKSTHHLCPAARIALLFFSYALLVSSVSACTPSDATLVPQDKLLAPMCCPTVVCRPAAAKAGLGGREVTAADVQQVRGVTPG